MERNKIKLPGIEIEGEGTVGVLVAAITALLALIIVGLFAAFGVVFPLYN